MKLIHNTVIAIAAIGALHAQDAVVKQSSPIQVAEEAQAKQALGAVSRDIRKLGEGYFEKYEDPRVGTLINDTRMFAAKRAREIGLNPSTDPYAFLLHNHPGYASEVSTRIQTGIDSIEINEKMRKEREGILADTADKVAKAQRERAEEEKARDIAKAQRDKILAEIARLEDVRLVEAKRAEVAKTRAEQIVRRAEAMQQAFEKGAAEFRLQSVENTKLKRLNASLEAAVAEKATRLETARILMNETTTIRPSSRIEYTSPDGEKLGSANTEISEAK